jgi:hypothetical protein
MTCLAPASTLESHVRRPLGTGVRFVELETFVDGEPGVRYRIAHAWQAAGGGCTSLFCVLAPGPFERTTVLVHERPFQVYPTVWIRPGTAARPLRVTHDHMEAPILCTDFSYDDLRLWTPRVITAATSIDERLGCVVLESSWLHRRRRPVTATAVVDTASGLVVDASWREHDVEWRRLRIDDVHDEHGVAMPTTVAVDRPRQRYASMLTLRRSSTAHIAESLWRPGAMDRAHDALIAL